jgi:hypothetical protein
MPVPRVFHPLLLRIVLVAIVPAAVVLWAFGAPAATCTGTVLAALELWRVRRAIRRGTPAEVAFVPTTPSDHPWLDGDAFREDLQELAALGFLPIADYSVVYPGAPRGFARVFVDPGRRVFAEVNQLRQGATVLPVATTFESVLTDGWSLQSTTREPMAVEYAFMRSPRSIWRSLPDAGLADLLEDHLALREGVCDDLGLSAAGDGTLEGYFTVQRENQRRRAVAARGTNIVSGIARGVGCERHARHEWLGDYPGTRRRRVAAAPRTPTVPSVPGAEAGTAVH